MASPPARGDGVEERHATFHKDLQLLASMAIFLVVQKPIRLARGKLLGKVSFYAESDLRAIK